MSSEQIGKLLESQIRTYFDNPEVRVESIEAKDARIFFYNHLSLILIGGGDFRMLLKIFSNKSDIYKMAETALGEIRSESAIVDFMKELANVLGGSIKRSMEASELQVGLSLPLSIKGFDELFSDQSRAAIQDVFQVSCQGQIFAVQVQVEFLTVEAKGQYDKIKFSSGDDSSGDLEFL